MVHLTQVNESSFHSACGQILSGLRLTKAREFPVPGLTEVYQASLVRESSDRMFRTEEKWVCTFLRKPSPLEDHQIGPLIEAATAADAGYLLAVIVGSVTPSAETKLRKTLAMEDIQVVLLTGTLAEILARDYAGIDLHIDSVSNSFSFKQLREHAETRLADSPWRKHFQTTSVQPMRLLPLNRKDASGSEADLFHVLQSGSFLLLGDPGAGKTTSLTELAGKLGNAGPRMPLFVPLGRYQGDFWQIVCEALAPHGKPVPKTTAQTLLASGAIVLLLDGINEVQNPELHRQLVEELNRLTDPEESTACSRWIVSGRAHDYQQSHAQLVHLEARRWEVQPLTADLVFRFVANVLGDAKGLALYHSLGETIREICTNPLLLNMVLMLYQETGQSPSGRGALYRQFVELLLRWGADRGLGANEQAEMAALLTGEFTQERYEAVAQDVLTALAAAMPTTIIHWTEAARQFASALSCADNPFKMGVLLLEDLSRRGILRRDGLNRVSFLHHTVQEYFLARGLISRPATQLIPPEGIAAAQREAVVFIAGLLSDPTPLVKRALIVDPLLAYEMVRDAFRSLSPKLIHEVSENLWRQVHRSGRVFGERRRWATAFDNLAKLLAKNAETVAGEIDSSLSRIDKVQNLMNFYAELGDAKRQQQALVGAMVGENVPEALLFRAALAAQASADYKRAIQLYTEYLKNEANDAAAFNNRANSYKAIHRNEEALADYRRAIELEGLANQHTNLAVLLHTLKQTVEAREQIEIALKKDSTWAHAQWCLATWMESEDSEGALHHAE